MSEPILELRDVSLYYGKIRAVDRVSLSVPADSIVGVIGPNGAGKSSLLRAISGVQVRVEGEIRFRGTRIDSLSPDKIVRLGIAHCPEGSQLFPEMSVKENLLMGAFTRRSRSDVQEGLTETFALFPILEERQTQQAGTLSGGERQMLGIARSLMGKPQLLMLDEPSLGLSPAIVNRLAEGIQRIHARGISVLLVEQNTQFALKFSSMVHLLEGGRVALSGRPAAIAGDRQVKAAYLGD